jgi:hypothetical protein
MLSIKKIIIILSVFTLLSCVSKQEINIDSEGRGSCTVGIELSSFYTEYIKDLSDAAGSGNDDGEDIPLFNKEMIVKAFETYSDAELIDVKIHGNNSLQIEFKFNSTDEILKEESGNPVLDFKNKGEIKVLSFNLNTENYIYLDRMFGLSSNPVLSALTPQSENPYTDDEYLDMVDFVFSDYDDTGSAVSSVENAVVEITVNTTGEIINASGEVNGKTAIFRIPLIRFLTLSKPISFSLEYK